MDAWQNVSTSNKYPVYTGLWTNWSRGPVSGLTLTLTKPNGSLVIAFSAFFVTLVAAAFWRILCLCGHQLYSTSRTRDALHHQRQVLLRNSATPQSGLWSLLQLSWASPAPSRVKALRTFPVALLALITIGVFTAITYLLPSISSSMGDEVLLIPGHCGLMDGNSLPYNGFQLSAAEVTKKVTFASNYGQQCYANGSGNLDCAAFVATRLPTLINNNASCPFHPEICSQDNNNLYLSTGLIDTNSYFGINSPENKRVLFSASLHCSPLVTMGYTSSRRSLYRNYTRYHYGVEVGQSFQGTHIQAQTGVAFEAEDIETQYGFNDLVQDYQYWPGSNFQLDVLHTIMYNGSITRGGDFAPIDRLLRYDGDTTLVFLRGNGVLFSNSSTDAWYRATRPFGKLRSRFSDSPIMAYCMNESASPLVCFQQFQFCHTGLPEDARCGVVGSMSDAMSSALTRAASSETRTQILWVYEQLRTRAGVNIVLRVLGSDALASRLTRSGGEQGQIADNQWQLDVVQWWATYLAQAQAAFVDATVGPI